MMESSTERAVVLARGLGRRMQEPNSAAVLDEGQRKAAAAGLKALMPIAGRPFLDFVLSAIADAGLTHVALVVAPDHDAFHRYYAVEHPPVRLQIDFVVQKDAIGTADAVLAAERWTAGESFLVMNSDNLYPADVLERLAALAEPGLPVFTRDDLVKTSNIPLERIQAFALVEVDQDGYVSDIVEKPSDDRLSAVGGSAAVSMNCWRFDSRMFEFCRDVPRSPRGEFELPEAVRLAVRHGVPFKTFAAHGPVLDLSRRADTAEVARRLATVTPRP
jgi:dTDP-glucose pyrophosphorylase